LAGKQQNIFPLEELIRLTMVEPLLSKFGHVRKHWQDGQSNYRELAELVQLKNRREKLIKKEKQEKNFIFENFFNHYLFI